MSFDLKKFTNELYVEYKDVLTKQEVDDLLNLKNEYNRDTPISTGKRLIIDNLRVIGQKEISANQDYSGAKIDFSLPFSSGVNILIADNLKGKSSIFKVIKYALTGSNSLKANIRKWIHHIFVNFSINEKAYTAYLDLSKRSISAYLLNGVINSVEGLATYTQEIIFEANSESSYESQINDFFFQQFTYYSLKWTQKSSQKDSDELLEAGASWKTYFKSILLESKDSSELMYGSQGKKVFQMLLGIELTYPINRLSVKKDVLSFEKAKAQSYNEQQKKQEKNNLNELQSRLIEIEAEIKDILTKKQEKISLAPTYEEYNKTLKLISTENNKAQKIEKEKFQKNAELNAIRDKQNNIQSAIYRLNKELEKSIKQQNDLREYVEIGILFSNLDIKHCPSCNHNVSETQKKVRLLEHRCSLCNENVDNDNDNYQIDKSVYINKIENLELMIRGLEKELEKLGRQDKELKETYRLTYAEIVSFKQQAEAVKDVTSLSARLQELEDIINSAKKDLVPDDGKKEKLIAEKAVTQFQIKELSAKKPKIVSDYDTKIGLLNSAIAKLSEERRLIGARVINRLSKLMADEIQSLGLTSVTEVKIDENFEVLYKQDNDFVKFENIAEGEQLRAKIAFYLSLIQLDIEFNFGRHTRLLIVDSPGKEEADIKYLEGLTLILNSIEDRYGDSLQILIGTAERQLSGILEKQTEFAANEYVF